MRGRAEGLQGELGKEAATGRAGDRAPQQQGRRRRPNGERGLCSGNTSHPVRLQGETGWKGAWGPLRGL